MTQRNASTIESSLHELLGPLLEDSQLELVDVVCTGLGTATAAVEIRVDHAPDHPLGGRIDLEGVSAATRLIDAALEANDPIDGAYTLEVSSPGLERPLRTPEHFCRFVGTAVSVKTMPSADGERRVEGRLDAADVDLEGAITVAGRVIAYADIERARTVFVWGPQPKPGKGSKPGSAGKSAKASPLQQHLQHPHKQAAPQHQPVQPVADHAPGGTR